MSTKIRIFVYLVIASIFVCYQKQVVLAAQEIYTAADDVVLLNSTTFTPTVFQSKNISFVVEFYNTFCGHCQAFAPIYKEIATRAKNWTSVVKITALDCAKDENIQTCIDNKVSGYPTILLYPANARPQDPRDAPLDLRSLNKAWTVDDIEENIIDFIANQTLSARSRSLASDALHAITESDPIHLKRLYHEPEFSDGLEGDSKQQELMIVVEDEKSYLGRKLILQYYRIHSRVEIRRVALGNKPFLRHILSDKEFDTIQDTQPLLVKIFDDESGGFKVTSLVHGEVKQVLPNSDSSERSDFVFSRFKTFLDNYYSVELTEISPVNSKLTTRKTYENHSGATFKHQDLDPLDRAELSQRLVYYFEASNRTVFATDLLHAIVYIITHEVPIKGDLTPAEYNSIRNLLTILLKYLPIDSWDVQLHSLLLELRTHLDKERTIYEKSGVKAKQMLNLLELSGSKSISEKYKNQWVSCMKSEVQQKGYTCAVWLLFHTLTVGEFVKAAPVRTNPSLVLFTMRDYITHFFGCTVCAINFQKETESLEKSLIHRNSSVLWLWATHNSVRQRLNNERLVGKKTLMEVLYPLYKSCPACFKTDLRDLDPESSLSDVQWDLDNVFNHLISSYRPDRLISPATMEAYQAKVVRDMRSEVIETLDANRSSGQSSIFSTSDISLCLILYLTCIIIVAIVCVSMNPKLKHMKIV